MAKYTQLGWPQYSKLFSLSFFVCLKALLSDGEEVGKACTYKYCRPWLGSSLAVAEGKASTPVSTRNGNTEVRIGHNADSFNSKFRLQFVT
jgi:hypothetical protein